MGKLPAHIAVRMFLGGYRLDQALLVLPPTFLAIEIQLVTSPAPTVRCTEASVGKAAGPSAASPRVVLISNSRAFAKNLAVGLDRKTKNMIHVIRAKSNTNDWEGASMAETEQTNVPLHPLLAGLIPSDQPTESPVELAGYVGPSSGPGKMRLYHSLQDLSHYLEFDETSVMFTAPASSEIAPNNGLTVWVKASTPIRWTREYKNANRLVAQIVSMAQGSGSQPPGIP